MNNLIPGNQKHLTLEDRLYIEDALIKQVSFKDIARFLCKDPTTISKEVRAHRLSDLVSQGHLFTTRITSVFTDIVARKPMSVTRSFYVESSALPVLPATRPVPASKKNDANDSIMHLTSAMAVTKRSITAPSLTSTVTMPGLLTANTVKNLLMCVLASV